MKPYYEDSSVQIFNGNCLDVLPELPAETVQCCVTSPPYWGLRKYAGEQDMVWGNNHCEHEWQPTPPRRNRQESDIKNLDSKEATNRGNLGIELPFTNTCQLCSAWRGAYGLEPSPELYVAHTIEILRAIRRVLRPDGVVFWNIGDSYAGSGCGTNDYRTEASRSINKSDVMFTKTPPQQKAQAIGLKPKDLCLIPFRVAIAAQEDGWWVRSVIIWSKPNPMPESVRDRPTESHEYLLMLTKAKDYYWDIEAVRELYSPTERWGGDTYKGAIKGDGLLESAGLDRERNCYPNTGRNLRTVWEINTQPYPEAHFATFPEKIPERCILAATSEKGNCSKCGKPWVRIVERTIATSTECPKTQASHGARGGIGIPSGTVGKSGGGRIDGYSQTLGWQPQCHCEAPSEPPVVLDPFNGSGTSLWVAKRLGRRAIGIDTSEEYCNLAIERNRQQSMNLQPSE